MSDRRQATDVDGATVGLEWSAKDGQMLDSITWIFNFANLSGAHIPRFLGEIHGAEWWGSCADGELDDTNFLPVLDQFNRASLRTLSERLGDALDFLPRLARFQAAHADRLSLESFKATRRALFILHRQVSLCALYLEDPPDFLNGALWKPFSDEAQLYSQSYSEGYGELGGLATKLRASRSLFPDPPPVVEGPEAEAVVREAGWLVRDNGNEKRLIFTAGDGETRTIEFSPLQVKILLYLRDKGKRSPEGWVDLKTMKNSLMPENVSPVLKAITQETRQDRRSFFDTCFKIERGKGARLVRPPRLGSIEIIPATDGPPPRPSRRRSPHSGPTC